MSNQMPDGAEFMLQQAMADHEHAVRRAIVAAQIADRKQMLRFRGLNCTCRPWFDWGSRENPADGCVIHAVLFQAGEQGILI